MARLPLDNSTYYINRETSWLAFNGRVLEEAQDPTNPLLERVKFLAITASNLDEFFEVRVAGLLQRIEDGYTEAGIDGLTPQEEAGLLAPQLHEFVRDQYACWNEQLRPALAENGVHVLHMRDLDGEARDFAARYCDQELDPLLTPVTVDPAHPFPRVINKALCQAVLLRRRRKSSTNYLGVITVPRALPRLIRLPDAPDGSIRYILLSELVSAHAAQMYRGYDIISEAAFRITRNSNLYLQEEESRNLLESVRTELHNRRKGDAVRLEIEADAHSEIVERLRSNFELQEWQVFRTDGPVNLSRLMHLYGQTDRPDLKYRPFAPRELRLSPRSRNLFEELRKQDILLHHPFDSYKSVVAFIEAAAEDPHVLSIKQTLYRTNDDSAIMEALMEAAAHKEVTVVVELKARFDEASNIRWARNLEDAGVQVFHGVVGLKTHCKLALLARKDPGGEICYYAHLGTGNYNPQTAAFYTDLSLLTTDQEITSAVHGVFNFLTAYTDRPDYEPLLVSPLDFAQKSLSLIAREADHARNGRPARIIAKMNALLDRSIIQELYRASQAGVQIDLIIRGMCALRPGIPGVSSRIRVRSIVGRFLEHSRMYYFLNGGDEEIYAGSADWMPRNLYERVEAVFPIRNPMLRQAIRYEILQAYLADTAKARILERQGNYLRPRLRGKPGFNAQDFLIAVAEGRADARDIPDPKKRSTRRTASRRPGERLVASR